jgi:hypothetical protein
MSYRPIGKKKILDSLFEIYCGFEAKPDKETAKEISHLNIKLQESFDQIKGKSVSAGYLAVQSFFIGQNYASIKSDKGGST